jgi:ribose transport system ATP-binding protein
LGEVKKYCECGTVLMNGCVTAIVRMDEGGRAADYRVYAGRYVQLLPRASLGGKAHENPILELKDVYLRNQLTTFPAIFTPARSRASPGCWAPVRTCCGGSFTAPSAGTGGEILVRGAKARIGKPADAVKLGIGLLTENRKEEGLFPELSCQDNIALADAEPFPAGPLLPAAQLTSGSSRRTGGW